MKKIIVVKNLSKSFGNKIILSDINFEVEAGKNTIILGGSGSGKSVFVKCLVGLMPINSGQVYFNDLLINKKNQHLLAKNIGMSFQGGALFDSLSVLDNICFGAVYGDGVPIELARQNAMMLLNDVGLDADVAKRYPSELSGGMQKRVALARATARKPLLYVFDEPTAGLDPVMSSVINRLIRETVKRTKSAAITITHDLRTMHEAGDNVCFLKNGQFVWHGTPNETTTDCNSEIARFVNGQY